MSDTMREAYDKWIMSDANRFGTSSRGIFEGGYQAAQADARALVGEFVVALETCKYDANSYYDKQSFDENEVAIALTKAQAFMGRTGQ